MDRAGANDSADDSADDVWRNRRRFEIRTMLALGAASVWLASAVLAPKLFLVYQFGWEHVRRERLKILAMPKGKPWPLSDGGVIESGFGDYGLIQIGCVMLLFFGTYPLVLLLPRRTAADDAADAGAREEFERYLNPPDGPAHIPVSLRHVVKVTDQATLRVSEVLHGKPHSGTATAQLVAELESGWLLPGMLLRVRDEGDVVAVLKIERPDRHMTAATRADGQIVVITPWDERLTPGMMLATHPQGEHG